MKRLPVGRILERRDQLAWLHLPIHKEVRNVIRKLAHVLPRRALRSIAAGLFSSKLLYALLVGNTWGFLGYTEEEAKRSAITKRDI